MTRLRALVVPLTALLVALVLLSWFFLRPLRVKWWDEARLLQAAIRHAQGDGLNYTINPGDNLTGEVYQPLAQWPPFYPLLISGLLQLGIPLTTGVKCIHAMALVLGLFGWLRLANRYLSGTLYYVLFAGLLVMVGGAIGFASYTTDYLLWAALPYWFSLVLCARQTGKAGTAWVCTLLAAVLVGLLVGFRWASAFLLPAGCLALLIPGLRSGGLLHRLALAVVYALPPLGVYFAIRSLTGGFMAGSVPKWEPENLLSAYPFEAFFSVPLGLEVVLNRIGRVFDPDMTTEPWLTTRSAVGVFFHLVVPLLFLVTFLWAWFRRPKQSKPLKAEIRELWALIGLTSGCLLLVLYYLSLRYRMDVLVGWSYLWEARYFRPFHPLMALFWLTALEVLTPVRWFHRPAVAVLCICLVCLALGEARGLYAQYTTPDESWELVQKVRKVESNDGLHIVIAPLVGEYLITKGPSLRTIEGYGQPDQVAHYSVDQEADLWVVTSVSESSHPGFHALVGRFNLKEVWKSSGGHYQLYHAHVRPGGTGGAAPEDGS